MKCRKVFFVIALVLSVAGCQKLIGLKAEVRSDDLIFTAEKSKNVLLTLYELEIYRQDCSEDCVYWRLSRGLDSKGNLTAATIDDGEVIYGQPLDGLETAVQPKQIALGQYIASGHAGIKGTSGARSFYYEFQIVEDEEGTWVVKGLKRI